MNRDDLINLAKYIYVQKVANNPTWDKQQVARDAIESATQFFLALQSEKEGSAYPSATEPQNPPLGEVATGSTEQSQTVYSVLQSLDSRKTTGNQQAAGRGMVRQRHLGQEMG